jgi:hypothetical protein
MLTLLTSIVALAATISAVLSSRKVKVLEEGFTVVGRVLDRHQHGESVYGALLAEEKSPEVQDIMESLFWTPTATPPAPPSSRGGAAVVLALLLVGGAYGCSSPITHQDVLALEKAIADERRAVTPRPGFEDAIAAERSGVDAKLAAMDKATSR